MKTSQTIEESSTVAKNFKWGQIKLDKIPKEIDTARLKQEKPILIDQPLLPSILTPDLGQKLGSPITPLTKTSKPPKIDSYIINTIKLNQILKNRISFDQVEFFRQSKRVKPEATRRKPTRIISSSEEARLILRQFITVMCLHVDFNEISSIAMDILIDVLDHFLESFFKLLKNLKSIPIFDVQNMNSTIGAKANFYNSEIYIEQALKEFGLGSIKDLKDFYLNDIVIYYKETYRKVNKMYEAHKQNKSVDQSVDEATGKILDANSRRGIKNENDSEIEEFMKDNDLLNDESSAMLGEFLTDLNSTHLDEEMNKLLQMIGHDPFSLVSEHNETSQSS